MQIMHKNNFYAHDVTDDVTEWRQIRTSIFKFKWNWHIFRDNCKTIWGMIIKLYA